MQKIERTKNATRNIVWGIVNRLVMILLPFATRTVMIYTMGMQYVGLGSLFTSILQVLSFAELGIGGALVFSMYQPMALGDEKKICALLNFYKKTYRIIGFVILSVGLCIMPFIKLLIAGDIPNGINIYLLYVVYLLNNEIGYFLFAYKQSIFTASQRIDYISKINAVLNVVSGLSQIFILVLSHNYYLYVLVIPVITCINNICIGVLADRYYPQYKCKGKIDTKELFEIKKKVGGLIFQKIGGIVLSSVDTIVISAFLGLTSLALYQNYYYIITSLFGFLTVVMQSIVAGVGNSIATENIEKNYTDFKKFNFIYIWIISWCAICLMCLYQPFMELWVGKQNMLGIDMVILYAAYFFVHKWCDMLYVYQEACGIWWETKFVPLIAAVVNLVMNIILVKIIGLAGILISTIVAVVLIYDTGYAKVLFKTYFKETKGLRKYWSKQFFYFITTVIALGVTYWICQFVTVKSLLIKLVINAFICIIIPNVIFIISYHSLPEFNSSKQIVKRMWNRYAKK